MADEIITTEKDYTDYGIASYLVGRLPIYTSIERFDPEKPEEMIAELNSALSIHVQNLIAMEYLYWYRRGITPIYAKTKLVRDEINNKISVNHASEIVEFKSGYFMTQPAFYSSRKEEDETNEKVTKLNEYLYRSGKQQADNKLVDWFHTVGKADLFVQANDDPEVPFVAYAVDPRSAFVAQSMKPGNRPVYSVHMAVDKETVTLDVSDDTNTYRVYGTVKGTLATPFPNYEATAVNVIDYKPNPLKKVPIIEYFYNSVRQSAFEPAISLLDAINALMSDRLDGVDQFIQSLLVFYNCELGEDSDGNPITPQLIRAMGAVFLKSVGENKADLKEISSQLDQTQTQVFVDDLYQRVLTICGMPNTLNSKGYSNASTGTAQFARDGWYQADTVARNTEDLFKESNRYFDEIITDILRNKGLLDISLTDFTLEFVRNETVNAQSKAQALQTYLAAGLHPVLALAKSGASNDPVADFERSKDYLKLIWGDPDSLIEADYSVGEDAALTENDSYGRQARDDEKLALDNTNRPTPSKDDGMQSESRYYYRRQNGKLVRVKKAMKKRQVDVQ